MRELRRIGVLIARLNAAANACKRDGTAENRPGKPPTDFLGEKMLREIRALASMAGGSFDPNVLDKALETLRAIRSDDGDAAPDFAATRQAIGAIKTIAKQRQRRLIEEAFGIVGMTMVDRRAHSEELLHQLEKRVQDLVGWIARLAIRCAKASRKLGEDEEILVGDLNARTIAELLGIHKMLLQEEDRLLLLLREGRRTSSERQEPLLVSGF